MSRGPYILHREFSAKYDDTVYFTPLKFFDVCFRVRVHSFQIFSVHICLTLIITRTKRIQQMAVEHRTEPNTKEKNPRSRTELERENFTVLSSLL